MYFAYRNKDVISKIRDSSLSSLCQSSTISVRACDGISSVNLDLSVQISKQTEDVDFHMDKYVEVTKIGTGAYGTVYRARDLQNEGKLVALKRIRVKNNEQGMPISTIREISLLKQLAAFRNPNVVKLLDMFHTPGCSTSDPGNREIWLNLVFEHVDQDLATYIEKCSRHDLTPLKIKNLTHQLLSAVDFLHANRVVHRDLKPQNILVTKEGTIKVADFGLARIYRSSMALTSVVVTLWYRSPEVLLQSTYATPVDLWSVGCVLAELYNRYPLFEGNSDVDQLHKIVSVIGSPPEEQWPPHTSLPWCSFAYYPPRQFQDVVPGMCSLALDLLSRMLVFCPYRRISAMDALNHEYFKTITESPTVSTHESEMRTNNIGVSSSLKREHSPENVDEEFQHKQVCIRPDRGLLTLPLTSNYSPPKHENIGQSQRGNKHSFQPAEKSTTSHNEQLHNFTLHNEQWRNERSKLESLLIEHSEASDNSVFKLETAEKENVKQETVKPMPSWFTPVSEDSFLQAQRSTNSGSSIAQRVQAVNPTYVIASMPLQKQSPKQVDENNNYVAKPVNNLQRSQDDSSTSGKDLALEVTSAFEIKGHSFLPKSSPILN